jgi:hypothetical protein
MIIVRTEMNQIQRVIAVSMVWDSWRWRRKIKIEPPAAGIKCIWTAAQRITQCLRWNIWRDATQQGYIYVRVACGIAAEAEERVLVHVSILGESGWDSELAFIGQIGEQWMDDQVRDWRHMGSDLP